MFIILNWWDDETIAKAQVVCKNDGSGETLTFNTREEAKKYAKEELNGHSLIVTEK